MSESNSKSFSDSSGIMWSGRGRPRSQVVVDDERDGGHTGSEIEAFRVRVRGLRFNDARARTRYEWE